MLKYSFTKIKRKDLERLRELRNQKKVREASLNRKIISKYEHIKYFNNIIGKKNFHYYKLSLNKNIIGVGYGVEFNKKKKSCKWGIYTDLTVNKKLKAGSITRFNLFNRLFKINNIQNLFCDVLYDFEWIKNWYIRWGSELISFNSKYRYYTLVLKKKKWLEIRKKIKNQITKKT